MTGLRWKVFVAASQPWPFPSSLMIGYFAEAASDVVRVNYEELDDARWFTLEAVAAADSESLRLPSRDSIARRLIEDWLAEMRPRRPGR